MNLIMRNTLFPDRMIGPLIVLGKISIPGFVLCDDTLKHRYRYQFNQDKANRLAEKKGGKMIWRG